MYLYRTMCWEAFLLHLGGNMSRHSMMSTTVQLFTMKRTEFNNYETEKYLSHFSHIFNKKSILIVKK
ncbi:hypothetical protein CPM_0349 [Cuniculiplasma divulgatum]|uniref:Uncharacterized protein n=1 Tax=Cuniculiplasma divulgatum TaxID=1673428 RepID=A0A1R4A5J5_9ARCH|nr:hypothetical protein CPM_0349 [Cuniculiplasma divulgatum]